MPSIVELTDREKVILKLVARGYTNKEIAGKLSISIDTVKKHLQNCYKKLGARNKIEALRNAGIL